MKNRLLLMGAAFSLLFSCPAQAETASREEAKFRSGLNRLVNDTNTKTAGFLKSIGATKAEIDVRADHFDIGFDESFMIDFAEGQSFRKTDRGGSISNPENDAYLSFWNKGNSPVTLILEFDYQTAEESFNYIWVDIYLAEHEGYLSFSPDSNLFFSQGNGSLQWTEPNLTVNLAANDWITFEVGGYSTLNITSTEKLPKNVEILTGTVPLEKNFWPKFKNKTSLSSFTSFFSRFSESSVKAALADFEAIEDPAFRTELAPGEFGLANKTVVEYADVRLLISLLKIFQASNIITSSYNMELDITAEQMQRYDSEDEFLRLNRNFLKPTKNNPKQRQRARELYEEAIDSYFQIETDLWSRSGSSDEHYLFTIGDNVPEADRDSFNNDLSLLRKSLRDGIEMENEDGESGEYFITLAPFFGANPVDLRALAEIAVREDEKALEESLSGTGLLMSGTDFFGLPASSVLHERNSEIFGQYNDTHFDHKTGEGWILHKEHGWLYFDGISFAHGSWAWDHLQQQWLWTGAGIYPFFFSDDAEAWRFYETGGKPSSRWFYFYEEEMWQEVR